MGREWEAICDICIATPASTRLSAVWYVVLGQGEADVVEKGTTRVRGAGPKEDPSRTRAEPQHENVRHLGCGKVRRGPVARLIWNMRTGA